MVIHEGPFRNILSLQAFPWTHLIVGQFSQFHDGAGTIDTGNAIGLNINSNLFLPITGADWTTNVHTAAHVGGVAYLGQNLSDSAAAVRKYDSETDAFVDFPDDTDYRLTGRVRKLVAYQDKMLACGIISGQSSSLTTVADGDFDLIAQYDPATGAWSQFTSPGSLWNIIFDAAVWNDGGTEKLIVVGREATANDVARLSVYDPDLDSWTHYTQSASGATSPTLSCIAPLSGDTFMIGGSLILGIGASWSYNNYQRFDAGAGTFDQVGGSNAGPSGGILGVAQVLGDEYIGGNAQYFYNNPPPATVIDNAAYISGDAATALDGGTTVSINTVLGIGDVPVFGSGRTCVFGDTDMLSSGGLALWDGANWDKVLGSNGIITGQQIDAIVDMT